MNGVLACEWVIREEGQTDSPRVRVAIERTSGKNYVRVRWFCGDKFYFTPDDAKAALDHIKTLGPYPSVVLDMQDSSGRQFKVRLSDGQVVADGYSTRVRFVDLQKAVKTALKALKDFG